MRFSFPLEKSLIPIVLGIVLGWVISDLDLTKVEALLYDERMEVLPKLKPAGHVSLAYLQAGSENDSAEPMSLFEFKRALQNMQDSGAKAIVSLLPPHHFHLARGYADQVLPWMRLQKNLYFADPNLSGVNPDPFPEPFSSIPPVVFPFTQDVRSYSKDGVTRRAMLSYLKKEQMHVKLAQMVNPEIRIENLRGVFSVLDSQQIWLRFPDAGSYPTFDLREMAQKLEPRLKDQIIIIAQSPAQRSEDATETPLNKGVHRVLTAEVHAATIDNILQNSGIVRIPDGVNAFLIILISIVTLLVAIELRPTQGLFAVVSMVGVLVVGNLLLFWPFGIWLNLSESLLSLFVCYYFVIPYRLIRENKIRWEVEQKHKLLSQVEELKTNFISMMSHDLKTPLARIKGMIELIRRDSSPLSQQQVEALDVITSSSGDLLGFIDTILNYANLESKGVELQLQSTDVNQVVENVLRKHDFLIKAKHIQIQKDLEPLFSIRLDNRLIEQVISNLLENALKYSPEQSTVWVQTREVDNFVEIEFKDQGPGLSADEIPNIFLKFYRSKSAKSSPIKGSGLGLYLARYFVDLHKGSIQVQSTPGQGATFTVRLPIDFK